MHHEVQQSRYIGLENMTFAASLCRSFLIHFARSISGFANIRGVALRAANIAASRAGFKRNRAIATRQCKETDEPIG
jgi:hypothetical protein